MDFAEIDLPAVGAVGRRTRDRTLDLSRVKAAIVIEVLSFFVLLVARIPRRFPGLLTRQL